jgi:hypothetical protein
VTQVLNALAACDVERGLIVLDDAHRVSDAAVFEFLDLLLERLPPQWGVVVASRTDPPLTSLARLRAHGELAEFRQRELRFTLDEGARAAAGRRRRRRARPRGDQPADLRANARLGGWPEAGSQRHPLGPRGAGG